jgi:2-polyprenyl-6-methoxyphenol hydroxylase-like FAD-dependent oxidoreductase
MKVCLVDRANFPSDTPSTHGILPAGVKVLQRLGLTDRLLEVAPPLDAGILAFDDIRIDLLDFTRIYGAPTFNVRRVTLDAILLEAAVAAGAAVRTATTVTGLLRSGGRVVGVETTAGPLRAPLVVGADGARSTVARLAGAAEYHRTAPRRVFLWAYFEGVDESERRIWLGNIGGDGFLASPSDNGLFLAAFVAPIARRDELRGNRTAGCEEGLRRWPELGALLAGKKRVGPARMMSRWHGFFRESAGPGWALVGDAGHFKDPTPGQGISDALRQAVALAPAIERALGGGEPADAPLREWWEWRDRDAWEMYWFAQDMGSPDRAPLLEREMQDRFAADPRLVEGFLRVLAHDLAPSQLLTPSLGLSLLGKALRDGRGRRLALLSEARALALDEFRRRALDVTGIRRPAY